MMDRAQQHESKPVPGLVFGLAGALATASIAALAAFSAPQPADALPAYAQQTKLACGRCHVSAAGGGALTAFGKAFAANGHKVPSKGAKPGKGVSEGTLHLLRVLQLWVSLWVLMTEQLPASPVHWARPSVNQTACGPTPQAASEQKPSLPQKFGRRRAGNAPRRASWSR
jgi:hypothetical protein